MSKFNHSYRQEEEIIKGCLENDRASQKALYDRFKTRMYTLAYRITGNFEDAGDVIQEGFLQVFRNLADFRGGARLGTWIHTIVAREAIRKIKSRIYFEDIDEAEADALIDLSGPIDIEYLEQAIAGLPEGYRAIFTLYEIEGFRHREIAELLNVSENTSKSQLFKAKRLLKEKLNPMSQ